MKKILLCFSFLFILYGMLLADSRTFPQISTTTLSSYFSTKAYVDGHVSGVAVFNESTTNIKMNGNVSVGTSTNTVHADHIHPVDTSRASQTQLDSVIVSTGAIQSSLNAVINSTGTFLIKTGDTMTGSLDITNAGISASTGVFSSTITASCLGINTTSPQGVLDIGSSDIFLNGNRFIYSNDSDQNTCVGYGIPNTGTNNTFLGFETGSTNSIGAYNTYLGMQAGENNTEGNYNTGISYRSLDFNTVGSENTSVGYLNLGSNTDGWYNTAVGNEAGYSVQVSSGNSFFGWKSGYNVMGNYNIVIGTATDVPNNAGDNQLVIGDQNFFFGDMAAGKIGIGTTTPSEKLEVNGNIKSSGQILSATSKYEVNLSTTSTPSATGIVGLTSTFKMYVSTGTSAGAWQLIGSQS